MTRKTFLLSVGAMLGGQKSFPVLEDAPLPPTVYDLRNEPEILEHHRKQPLILDADNYVENVFIAVGFASRCWGEHQVFDTDAAIRVANELCAMTRLHKEGKIR